MRKSLTFGLAALALVLGMLVLPGTTVAGDPIPPPPTNRPPDCTSAAPSVAVLWPPNSKFVPVTVTGVTDPDGDPVSITVVGIFQDEPVQTVGDGQQEPDASGVGTGTARLRAERSGTKKVPGDGRFYHVFFIANDGNGGVCSGAVRVCVPHDINKAEDCVDGGPIYDSTVP